MAGGCADRSWSIPARHLAADVGDEPLMMSQDVPVAVARNRIDGVALAKSQRASVILMDDGFQNPSVAKDASLIVIDSERGLGNGRVLPAGPLRAPLKPQLARTDALVVVGDGGASAEVASAVTAKGGQVFAARLKPDETSVAALTGKRLLAFAGIGDPARFFRTLRACGLDVVRERAFADHHVFSESDLDALHADARRDRLTLVTTEKDFARLRGGAQPPAFGSEIAALAVTLEFADAAALRKFLAGPAVQGAREKIPGAQANSSTRSENAAAAPRSAAHRLPAGRRSSISIHPAESAHLMIAQRT